MQVSARQVEEEEEVVEQPRRAPTPLGLFGLGAKPVSCWDRLGTLKVIRV
jgi:hypothetical protein